MKKIKKNSIRIAMIGAIVGIAMSIVFSKSPLVLGFIPIASAIGGLIGTIIDKKRSKKSN